MAEVVLHPDPISAFPPATQVKIYKRPVGAPRGWVPSGAALSEPVVLADGSLKVVGLEENVVYVATAVVGGVTRTVRFEAGGQATPGGTAIVGDDGFVGGPKGSPLSPSVGTGSLTLASLRETVPVEGRNYFLFEIGKEGYWRYDPTDTTSADNTGTIVVTGGGKRLKRVIPGGGAYAPEWFGAKGDWKDTTATLGEGTDDTAAFQACANAVFTATGRYKIWLSSKYLVEGTVLLNQTGSALEWVPIDISGPNDASAGSRGHGAAVIRRKAGAVFKVNLNAEGKTVLPANEQYFGLSYGGFSFIGKSLEEGVAIPGMIGFEVFRTRVVQRASMYVSRFDWLMFQPEKDAEGNENYCDNSHYAVARCDFSTKSCYQLVKNDAGKVDMLEFGSPLSTVTGAIRLWQGAGTAVEGVLFHTTSTEWAPTGESALIEAHSTRGLRIIKIHSERQLAFHSNINLVSCRDTIIETVSKFFHQNTFLRNNKSIGTEVRSIHALDAVQAGFYDIEFIGTAAENAGYRQGPLDLRNEAEEPRAPVTNGVAVQGPQRPLANSFVVPVSAGASTPSKVLGNETLRAYPIDVQEVIEILALGAEIVKVGEAGSVFRLGLWAELNGIPGALLKEFGTIHGDSATVQEATPGSPLVVTPGRYFLGAVLQGAPATQPEVTACNAAAAGVGARILSSAAPTAAQVFCGYEQAGVNGALGAWTAGRKPTTVVPRLFMKVA